MRRGGSFSDEAEGPEIKSTLRQIQELAAFAQRQREHQRLPRLESIRHSRTASGGNAGLSLELAFLRQHPEALATSGCELPITLALRLPSRFPDESPMVACIAGGEHLPDGLRADGQLVIPWIRDGWSGGYSLCEFAKDVCASLAGQVVDQSHPPGSPEPACGLLLPLDSPPQRLVPSAPTFYDHLLEPESSQPTPPPPVKLPTTVAFNCKWREQTLSFSASPPHTLQQLHQLLFSRFSGLIGKRVQLIEFTISKVGNKLDTTKDWHRVISAGPKTVFILVRDDELTSKSVDLLGLADPERREDDVRPAVAAPPAPVLSPLKPAEIKSNSVREILWADLKMDKLIGSGSSCRVYKASWRGTEVAVKMFTGTNPAAVEKEFSNEVGMMAKLGPHPSLVLFLAITPRPQSIIFEYLPFSLFELINRVDDTTRKIPPFPRSWTKRVTMMLDVARGLQFLHSFSIIHRDLKSLNLLVTAEGRVKLADFGISRVAKADSDVMTGCCGTFQWMAPEVIQSAAYSVSADIYSFGIVMWEICEAAPPFADLPPTMVPIAVVRDKKRPNFSPHTPEPLQTLIRSCWQDDAGQRPSAADVVSTLQSFFPGS